MPISTSRIDRASALPSRTSSVASVIPLLLPLLLLSLLLLLLYCCMCILINAV